MKVKQNISLKPYNTFNINVVAKKFASFSSLDELNEILEASSKQPIEKLILGGGSNILFTKNFDGIVLKNELKGIELINEDDEYYYVKAAAGEVWHNFVQYCIEKNYAGVENLSLIPGNVGASPMQNIGAYGVEIKDVFYELEALHIHDKTITKFGLKDCEFGYRESVFKRKFKKQFIILNVTYKLKKQPNFNTSYGAIEDELKRMDVKELSIQAISQAVINIRTSKLPNPKEIGNAGSFFKNPTIAIELLEKIKLNHPTIPFYNLQNNNEQVKIAAGWLIEQCGFKGYRKNDAGCHTKQALVLVNYGNAKGEEILDLCQLIISSVKSKFDIELEAEVNVY